jgi:tetratricopeptide (TPR) repeat protein
MWFDLQSLVNVGNCFIKLGKFDEAIIYINQALKIEPHDLVALSNKKVAINHGNISLRTGGGTHLFEISCQIEVRNSRGNLVAYMEPPDLYVYNEDLLYAVLDTQSSINQTLGGGQLIVEKSNLTKNGKEFEKTHITVINTYNVPDPYTVASQTGVLQGNKWLLWANHDGYQLLSGDKLIQKWEIIRPV